MNCGWVIDKNDEGSYIDIDQEELDENHVYSKWSELPDLLLEEIFSYLTIRERYYGSLICRNWYKAFYLSRVWSNFIIQDSTLTRPKYNYYSGWQLVLDHLRAQSCLIRVGRYLKGLDFRPVHSFNNLYQFITLITWCIGQAQKLNCSYEMDGIGMKINQLSYVFPCNMAATDDPDGIKLFGTGGQLLAALKRLLAHLPNLKKLKLIDLMLERYEAKHLLDEVLEASCLELKMLHLINVTTVHCPIMHIGLFLNLTILTISPQNIDDSILELLANSNVRNLNLYQNRYTPPSESIAACSRKVWIYVKRNNPKLSVHLRIESIKDGEVLIQPAAPVRSITYQSPKSRITIDRILEMVDNYKYSLQNYGYEMLPRFSSPKSFSTRSDSLLMLLIRQCPFITRLAIRENISTATVLLIVRYAQNLQWLHIRRNSVRLRCDWPRNPEWDDEFYQWLKLSAKSYESCEREVSQILGYRWNMLSDKDYKHIDIASYCGM